MALCRASQLGVVAVANHQMEGVIPPFTSRLSRLALQKNHFRVLPDLHLENSSTTAILLHDNLLSCVVPRCGHALSAHLS